MKLFGSAKGGARVAKRSKKTKADKPKKPLKVLAIVLTVVLCLEGLYFLCIYSNIPFIKKYRTIPMLIQYFRGSYGRVEMGPIMACIMLTVLPIIILYLACQKYIIEGVVAGAVKG